MIWLDIEMISGEMATQYETEIMLYIADSEIFSIKIAECNESFYGSPPECELA